MNTILLPIAALMISLLLVLLFFSKKRMNNYETKVYSIMLILNLIYSFLCVIGFAFAKLNGNINIIRLIQKIYMVHMLALIVCMIIYNISILNLKNRNKKILNYLMIFTFLVFSIFVLSLPLEVINYDDILDGVGLSLDVVVIATIFYLIIVLITSILFFIKNKTERQKNIPFATFITLYIIGLLVRSFFPSAMFENFFFSFMLLLMYFTIENPDLQMLREFHKAREREEDSNVSKTNFIFTAQNKIKQPILEIKNISSDALNINDPEELKNEIRRIQASTNELSRIVNDVLDISEIENKVIDIKKNKYNLLNMFTVINKNFEKTLPEKINYRFNFDSNIPEYLYGDSIRLKQVLNIVLENAREYTKEGFIEVNVHSIIKNDICRIIITIEDSGIGMTTEEQNHLFDKEKIYSDKNLKTVDDTKNNISLAKSIITLMGGSIMVNSEIGKGSKFTIIVDQKIYEEKTKIIETVEKYEEMYEHNKKIMLVINNEDLSKKLNRILKKQNYDIIEVKGGQACLERLRDNQKFDLILMEEKLEKLSSEDTLNKKKDTPGYKIPIILISDNKGFGAKEMYQDKGFNDVIFIPIKKEQVLEIIRKNIEK